MTSSASKLTRIAAAGCPSDKTFTRLLEGLLSDDELQALQVHGDGCAACGRTLAELARSMTPGNGDWLGERYQLLEPVGIGGMGVVYTAIDTKLQRKVAVKRLRELAVAASADRRRARFLREAQLLASLSHPNVLTVHDVGGVDPELYVVMELVDGWPMSRWITEADPRPGWRRILDVYEQAGRGLSAAHQLGVVHRDVKPENILVARNGRVLIGDFGLAGLVEAGGGTPDPAGIPTGLTQTGSVLGTPAYMAPEQHDGRPADMLSDQFSFCVSLFESLHGRRPFPGQTAAEIVAAMRTGRPAVGGGGVPRAVDRVVARGLAVDPRQRHPSMDALLGAIAGAREPRPLKPMLFAGVMGVALAAIAAAAIVVARRQPNGERPQAVALPPPTVVVSPPPAAPVTPREPPAGAEVPGRAAPPARPTKRDPAARAAALALAREWSIRHPGIDLRLLLEFADGSHGDRKGADCLATLNKVPLEAWPPTLSDRALRRRASCEMLRGNCAKGRRQLELLDGADSSRAAALANCPVATLPTIEDRLLAVSTQADDVRYTGNTPARRRELKQTLQRETASALIQTCFHDRNASRACGRRLATLARAYQVLAEAYLADRDCADGAALDVMRSQVKFQSVGSDGGDPALRCRSERVFAAYKSCGDAGIAAERRCLTRAQAARRDGVAVLPDIGR